MPKVTVAAALRRARAARPRGLREGGGRARAQLRPGRPGAAPGPRPGRAGGEGRHDHADRLERPGPGAWCPSVKNTRTELAIRELEKAELKVTADPQPSDTVKKGFAIGTSPEEGDRVERGSRVRLFVSSGPEQATMPDVVGLTREAAETRLTREGLDVRVVRQESDEPEDEVIAQSPAAGTKLDKGERVTITISEGKQQVDVPNLVGLSEADAERLLRGDKLGITVRRRTTDNEEEDGQVLDQRPGAGVEVDEGRSVIVIVGRFEAPEEPADPGVTAGSVAVRVAVLGGGRSSEHDVSLASAAAVRDGLEQGGHEPVAVEIARDGRWSSDGVPVALEPAGGLLGCDVAFPVLHGPYGEDGTVQGLLEALDVPYVGRGRDGLGGLHGQGAVQGPDGGQPPAAGRLPRDAGGRGSGQAPAARPARVREARPAGLVGRASRRCRPPRRLPAALEAGVRARPAGDRGGDVARHGGRVLGAGQPRPRGLGAGRDRDRGRVVRLRGEVRAGRHGAGRAGAAAGGRAGARPVPGAGGLPAGGLCGHGPLRLLRRRPRGRVPRAGERAEHDPGLHRHERLRAAVRGERGALPRAAGPPAGPGARAPRARAALHATSGTG